jgi:hypothetical protein
VLSCFSALLFISVAPAQTIDVSLNVFYTNPGSIISGGTWELVAKSGNSGIAGLSVLIAGITTAQNEGPRGTVNGSDPAGFSQFFNTFNPLDFRQLTMGQAPLAPGTVGAGEEQSVFYGVGTLANGAPNYPMKPPGTNSIGPSFTSLANVVDVPWATGDAFGDAEWSTAARLAGGTFAAGLSPSFFQGEGFAHSGNVFATTGTSTTAGTLAEASISTIVRTNFSGMLLPDYNRNGFVDTPDYVLWRKLEGMMGAGLAADGNNDGKVDQADYDLWRAHFNPPTGTSAVLPDYNKNGSVDAPDFVLWRDTEGLNGSGLVADGNNDSMVSVADYNLWRAHFGANAASGTSAALFTSAASSTAGLANSTIPEPAGCLLMVIGAALCGYRARRASSARPWSNAGENFFTIWMCPRGPRDLF